jgi:hypothetical protein
VAEKKKNLRVHFVENTECFSNPIFSFLKLFNMLELLLVVLGIVSDDIAGF